MLMYSHHTLTQIYGLNRHRCFIYCQFPQRLPLSCIVDSTAFFDPDAACHRPEVFDHETAARCGVATGWMRHHSQTTNVI
eukprot:Skav202630  [mRNA]  locus=scaffold2813:117692:117931:+ [translate_table: standard]